MLELEQELEEQGERLNCIGIDDHQTRSKTGHSHEAHSDSAQGPASSLTSLHLFHCPTNGLLWKR